MKGAAVNQFEILSPAKVNLFLEILGRRTDGFHELETVMSTVSLFDRLRLTRRTDDQINLRIVNEGSLHNCDQAIPTDDRNLVVRALKLLRQGTNDSAQSHPPLGCDVLLFKNIPSEAGLGGASSNAAAALLAGRQIWNLDYSHQQLLEMAAELGSDVPFFMIGGTAVCRGRGEIIEPIKSFAGLHLVIAKPKVGLATRNVFQRIEIASEVVFATATIECLAEGHHGRLAATLFNRLQSVASKMTNEVGRLSNAFESINCPGHQMSGSGTSYYGIFATHRVARIAAQTLSTRLPDVRIICSQTLGPKLAVAA